MWNQSGRPDPVKLSGGNAAKEWAEFEQKLNIYLLSEGKSEATPKEKWSLLMRFGGQEVFQAYNGFKESLITRVMLQDGEIQVTDNSESYQHVINEFRKLASENKSLTASRELFNARRQKPNEAFAAWYTDLKNLIKECGYEGLADSMLKDRLVWGTNDRRLKESLRAKPNLSLEEAVELCKAAEALAKLDGQDRSVDAVSTARRAVKRPHPSSRPNPSHRTPSSARPHGNDQASNSRDKSNPPHSRPNCNNKCSCQQSVVYLCKKCGTRHGPRKCPAHGKRCYKCGALGHYEKVCDGTRAHPKRARVETVTRAEVAGTSAETPSAIPAVSGPSPPVAPQYLLSELSNTEEDQLLEDSNMDVDVVHQSPVANLREYTETLCLKGRHQLTFKLDPGSEVNLIPFEVHCDLNRDKEFKLGRSNVSLQAFNGSSSQVEGVFSALTEAKHGVALVLEYHVTKACRRPILGIQACEDLLLITRVIHPVDSVVTPCPETKEEFVKANLDVFSGLGQFKQTIHLEVDASASAGSCPPRRYSSPITDRLKSKLDALVAQGVVEKVTGPLPKFISNLVIREKKDGELRLCLDPQALNKALVKQKYPIPTLDEISCRVRDKCVFTVLDLKDGFWHAALDAESSLLCSFWTPHGVYKFKKLPFGISTAPEIFQYLTDLVFGETGGIAYFDDILVPGKDLEEHDKVLRKVLDMARSENVKFNPRKIQYRMSEVKFLGLLWAKNQIRIDPDRTRAIQALQPPKTRHMLQKVVGTFNHLRKFIPQMGTIAVPLCELLSSKTTFHWLPPHDEAFQKLKDCVSNAPFLVPYDPSKPVIVQADASKDGLGAVLLQEGKLISSASRKLTPYEQNWAQIEKEMVALSFGAEKFKLFIYGMKDVLFQTDHQPLVSIFKKPVHQVTNNRLKKLRLKMMIFNPVVEYLPGKDMYLADLLSRNYIQDDVQDDPEMLEVVHEVTANLSIAPGVMEQIKTETSKDAGLVAVTEYYKNGWPRSQRSAHPEALPYWSLQNELFVEDSLVILGEKVVVPVSLRPKVLHALHAAHQGVEKTKARARQLVFWPNITRDIKSLVRECRVCERYSAANYKEPLLPHKIPDLPYQKVSADILEFLGQPYLVIVDNYSKWLDVKKLASKSSSSVIAQLRTAFSTHGIPEEIFGDNNPLDSYECRQFAEGIGSSIVTSSPEYPRSNGLAEKGVHIAKQILRKCHDNQTHYLDALREYNNTPLTGMELSPAQLLMSRLCRTSVPSRRQNLEPKVVGLGAVAENRQARVKKEHDKKARRKPVAFEVGDSIVFYKTGKWLKGTIMEKLASPRSYIIRQLSGRLIRRNTWHLRPSSTTADRLDEPPVVPYPIESNKNPVLQRNVGRRNSTPQHLEHLELEPPVVQPAARQTAHPVNRPATRPAQQQAPGRVVNLPIQHGRGFTRRGRPIVLPARYRQ